MPAISTIGRRLAAALGPVLLALVFAGPAAAQPGFGSKSTLTLGFLPREVHLADLNVDGHLDLVAACEGESFVGIFLGHGDGTFAPRTEVPTADGPRTIAVTDWNADGKPDLLVYANGALRVSSFLGVGDGTFVTGPYADIVAPATRLVPADLDEDGILDLAASTDAGITRLFTIRGLGGGAFGLRSDLDSLGGSQAYDVAVGQLDDSGPPDLFLPLTCNCPSHLLTGLGGGLFAPRVEMPGTSRYLHVLPLDIGSDGRTDLVVSDGGSAQIQAGGIRVLWNQGGGQFSVGTFANTGRGASALALGPWGGANERDVVVANSLVSSVTIVRILCEGSVQGTVSTTVGSVPIGLAVGDVDEDGVADVVTANQGDGTATIIRMTPNAAPFPCDPLVSLSANSLDFGAAPQSTTTTRTLTISNIGTTSFSVNSAITSPFFEFSVSVPTFPKVLGPGQALALPVHYVRSNLGAASGTLTIGTSDPFHPSMVVQLNGTATAPAPFVVSEDSLVYGLGLVGVGESKSFTISNVGSAILTVSQATVDNAEFSFLSPVLPFTVQVGGQRTAAVRYNRLNPGAAAGRLRLVTNDPLHATVYVELVGEALAAVPRIAVAATLGYGLGFVGAVQDKPVTISNTGFAPLHVTALSFSGSPEFSLVGPGAPVTIAPGAAITRTIRYARAVVGDATGTFHIASDDSVTPVANVALTGSASPAPAIAFSAPPRPTLAAGTSTTVQVVVRNQGPGLLEFTPAALGTDLVETSPFDGASVPLPEVRIDPGGGSWDIQADGRIGTGTTGEYNGGLRMPGFPPQASAQLGVGGQELRLGPAAIPGGLLATRKVFVPTDGAFARIANVLENPGASPVSLTIDLPDSIAYFPPGPIETSSGNGSFTQDDPWMVVPPDDAPGRRAAGRVSFVAGAPHPPSTSSYAQTFTGIAIKVRHAVTVPAHGRVTVLEWGVQGATSAAAQATAAEIAAGVSPALRGLAAIDRSTLWNAPPLPAVFRTAALPASIAPGDSVIVDLVCDAAAATLPATIEGTLRISSNDPLLPVVSVPIGFDVTGGDIVGVPPPRPTDAQLALAGLVPNPASRGGTLRVAYALATAAPATLTAFDVRGRVVARREIAAPQPGPGSLELATRLPAGVIWLRLEQAGQRVTRKAIVLP